MSHPSQSLLLLALLALPGVAGAGMVAFFDRVDGQCPDGWRVAGQAQGRLLKGTLDARLVGRTQNAPMQDKTPPTHTHKLDFKFVPTSKTVVAVEELLGIRQNEGVAKADHEWSETGETGASDGDIPYMQLLACEETGAGTAAAAMSREMVAFFNDRQCPADWQPYRKLDGRFVVPTPDETETGGFNQAVGTPTPNHTHTITTTTDGAAANKVNLGLHEIGMEASEKGVFIKERDGFAKNQSPLRAITATAQRNDALVPTLALLPCQKVAGRARTAQLPELLTAFMAAESCPDNWREKTTSHGRYLVGLPAGPHAKSGTAFGGAPLKPGEMRTHAHTVNHRFDWPTRKFVGFTGSTNKGFAAAGAYDLSGTTAAAALTLPYVQMRQCVIPSRASGKPSGGIRQ